MVKNENDTSTVKDNISSTTGTSVPLQLGVKNDTSTVKNDTSTVPIEEEDTSNFWFSLASAIGSAATAAALGVIIYQTRLTKKQIAQTQKELDNTLRPWLGLLQTYGKDIEFYG